MAKIIKPDSSDQLFDSENTTVFLAGSIDNGKASLWSHVVQEQMRDFADVTLFNPRRDEWLPDIEQRARNEIFNQQVNWELDNLTRCDIPFFYFESGSVSPITLQELGYVFGSRGAAWETNRHVHKAIVCCPDGFWRKGNVEIMCHRHQIAVYDDLNEAVIALKIAVEIDRGWKAETNPTW